MVPEITREERKQTVDELVSAIRSRHSGDAPRIGLVLGSGLGPLAERIKDPTVIPYGELPGVPESTVPGHEGRLLIGAIEGVPVVAMQGRAHLYEGYSPDRVVLMVRALRTWGVEVFFISNAAGSLNRDLAPGSLMLLKDHINLQGTSCLTGPNVDEWGPRFPDMTDVYDEPLSSALLTWAKGHNQPLAHGVYAALYGPSYETPAEIGMLDSVGADVVGMSTVQEVIALRHMGARVIGISCVTNWAAGIGGTALSHDEVAVTANAASQRFAELVIAGLHLVSSAID